MKDKKLQKRYMLLYDDLPDGYAAEITIFVQASKDMCEKYHSWKGSSL
jgi:hypothetical protein